AMTRALRQRCWLRVPSALSARTSTPATSPPLKCSATVPARTASGAPWVPARGTKRWVSSNLVRRSVFSLVSPGSGPAGGDRSRGAFFELQARRLQPGGMIASAGDVAERTPMRKRTVLAAALTLMVAAGCGQSEDVEREK